MVEAAQQCRAKRLAVVACPLVDDQPATRVEFFAAALEKAPGQMPGARPLVGVQVEKDQVGGFCAVEQLGSIADANGQPWVVVEPEKLHGQARHVRS